ncbi:MAG: Mfa1 family fimbria major subunit [Muribaculaceae bacterium]|nr:Mfa1 family fimbria major subunit [Muribaculaceae bacterium]
MKKIYGFAFAAAVMALASCSNDNEPVNNPNPTPAPAGPGSYVAVNICNPANTRAEGYEVGSTTENNVASGTFYIFKTENNVTKLAYEQPLDANASWQGPLDMGNTVEVIGGTTLLIPGNLTDGLVDSDGNVSAGDLDMNGLSVLVVLNDKNGDNKKVQLNIEETLDECLAKLTSGNFDEATSNDFLMSNSTYYNADLDTKIVAVPITSKNLVATAEEAKKNPVNIYVERTVARIDYKKVTPAEGEWLQNNKIHWENEQALTEFTPEILGVEIVYNPSNSSLFKQFDSSKIDSNWSTLANLNDAGNFRSFWATMPESGIVVPTFTYNDIVDKNFNGTNWENGANTTFYLHENTSEEKPSTVLVYAQLKDNENKPVTMAALYGQYTTKDGAINMVANTIRGLGYRIEKTDAEGNKEYRTVNPSDLAWSNEVYSATENDPVPAESGNRTYLKLGTTLDTTSEKVVKVNGTAYADSSVEALNAELAAIAISVWEEGYCYYYTTISHVDKVGKKKDGVVRNHLYQINFTGMSGLGTPVFDPDKDVIPVDPKYDEGDNVFLAAQINVLQWRVASQDVILGGKK